ncbi:hypothetical protein ATB90_13460 [Flavobacterium psychrophilum]|nr:hypothetical protein ATB90_13460 [Flavobacterium psychrophilum]
MEGWIIINKVAHNEKLSATNKIGLRPTRSEMPPRKSKTGISPKTYAANTSAVAAFPYPACSAYAV